MTTILEIPAGETTVRVEHSEYFREGRGLVPEYAVKFHDGERAQIHKFRFEDDAKAKAKEVATHAKRGHVAVASLKTSDLHAYVRCRELLEPLDVPITVAVEEYVHAKAKLPAGVSLSEVVAFYLKRGMVTASTKTVRDVVSEFLATKMQAGASESYLSGLECNLRQFERAFDKPLAEVAVPVDTAEYLNTNSPSPETWLVKCARIRALYAFAVKRKYLPADILTEYDGMDKPLVAPKDIEIFTAAELRLILDHATSEMVPWLALGAFCGIRHAELNQIEWSHIDLANGHIRLSAAKTKTRSTRMIELPENLRAWITPYAKPDGLVCEVASAKGEIEKLTTRIQAGHPEFRWKQNAMRHSWISYKLALTNDENAVSQMAGNSPAMIIKHYRALVPKTQAEEWFNINPK